MSFLAPLFLIGLIGLAIPILIHLTQRERRRVVHFPSLMFLQKVPFRQRRRRHIRHWPLLLLRLAALALIVAAFARPFVRSAEVAAVVAADSREVVILLDHSYSMGYGDRWARAQAAARDVVRALGPEDRGSVVLFGTGAEIVLRSTGDRSRLLSAIDVAQPTAAGTRYAPALKVAASLLEESPLPRREVALVTDFQRIGWEGAEGAGLPPGATLTPISVGGGEIENVGLTAVSLQRSNFANQERIAVTANVINRGERPVSNREVALEMDGRTIQTEQLDLEAYGSATVAFAPFTITAPNTRGTVRLAPDALMPDNVFHFVVSPAEAVRILVVDPPGGARDGGLYLTRALAVGDTPRFDIVRRQATAVAGEDVDAASVMVLNNVPVVAPLSGWLAEFVERGGGLLVVLGEHATWPSSAPDVLPALPGAVVDRTSQAARLAVLERGHEVFEPFRAPRSGDFSSARFYGYRAVQVHPSAEVLARFDDGRPALIERRIGRGRVLVWTTTLDLFWGTFALEPVYLPFVHRVVRYLAAYREPVHWFTVGQVLAGFATPPASLSGSHLALTPSGRRLSLDAEEVEVLELTEQGFYDIRWQGSGSVEPLTVASNVDLAESDLTAIDPQELIAAVTGRAGGRGAATAALVSDDERARAQRIWWYLLFAGLLLLGMETLLSSRLSRTAGSV